MVNYQNELKQLEHHYNSKNNEIVLFYGNGSASLSEILSHFLNDKTYFYYKARSCSDKLQTELFYEELKEEFPKGVTINKKYSDILSAMLSVPCKKRIIVLDEFHLFFKSSPQILDEIIKCVHNKWNNQQIMFLLCSSSNYWVEHSMLSNLKEKAYEISSLIKVNPLTFDEFKDYFEGYGLLDQIKAYAVFASCPDYRFNLDNNLTLSGNIIQNVLKKGSYYYEKGMNILPGELRESAVYNTILFELSSGRQKLNDLYKATGFSRAKISVYLKNLSDFNLVQKIESYNSPGHENTQKGVYKITDSFTRFWFRFVFQNYSKLELLGPEKYYHKYIEGSMKSFSQDAYVDVCKEYLLKLNSQGDLKHKYTNTGSWYGKAGTLDFVMQDENMNTLIACCYLDKPKMSMSDYEWDLYCIKQSKLKYDSLYLFSLGSFDEKLREEESKDERLVLTPENKFMNKENQSEN